MNVSIRQSVDLYFPKLNIKDKGSLVLSLNTVVNYLRFYQNISSSDISRDIIGIFVLLYPTTNLFELKNLLNLNDLFVNTNYSINKTIRNIEYIKQQLPLLKRTIESTAYGLHVNYVHIIPMKFNSDLQNYLNNVELTVENNKLGFCRMYDSIHMMLYKNIKPIKWLLYDVVYKNNIYPLVIVLNDLLNINDNDTVDVVNRFNDVLFNVVDDVKLPPNYFYPVYQFLNNDNKSSYKRLFLKTPFDTLYKYIIESIIIIKLTWYRKFLFKNSSMLKNDNTYIIMNISEYSQNLLTPKIYYNYFKYLVKDSKYESNSWYDNNSKEEFIDKINKKITKPFNIKNNLKRIYQNTPHNSNINIHGNSIDYIQSKINDEFNKTSIIDIIFENLIINGILTQTITQPSLTNELFLPNKNTKSLLREQTIKRILNSNIDKLIHYSFLTNDKLTKQQIKRIIDSYWYKGFAGTWLGQLQQYHHIFNNGIQFVTGATGAGKSTIYPFINLYSFKAFGYILNPVVVCTEPRTKPTVENANYISMSLGYDRIIEYHLGSENKVESNIQNYYGPKLQFMTDGYFYNIVKKSLNTEMIYNKMKYNAILVDEAHEHNIYMTMLLTLLNQINIKTDKLNENNENAKNTKNTIDINKNIVINIPICIISATMEYDEENYRKFFKTIDLVDERIHLTLPFETTNYDILTITDLNPIPSIIDKLLKTQLKGDILIFQPGQKEIEKLLTILNNSTPSYILVIPFHSKLSQNTKDLINTIHTPETRKYLNKLNKTDDIETSEFTGSNSYKHIIIIATNIAEASITIKSLYYVIDTGTQKDNIYDYNNDIETMTTSYISLSSQTQRRGRIGRVMPGTFIVNYDSSLLKLQPVYKIININMVEIFLFLIVYFPIDTVIDVDGSFYLFHPNEDIIIRNIVYEIKNSDTFDNKLLKVIDLLNVYGIMNGNILTSNGNILINAGKYDFKNQLIKSALIDNDYLKYYTNNTLIIPCKSTINTTFCKIGMNKEELQLYKDDILLLDVYTPKLSMYDHYMYNLLRYEKNRIVVRKFDGVFLLLNSKVEYSLNETMEKRGVKYNKMFINKYLSFTKIDHDINEISELFYVSSKVVKLLKLI